MATSRRDAQALIKKIQSLPTDRITEVADFVDFLAERAQHHNTDTGNAPLNFPVDDLGPWPEGLSLRREDMYDADALFVDTNVLIYANVAAALIP